MKILNRYIFLFLVLVGLLFFGVSKILQSTFVGNKISREISNQVFSKLGLSIRFDKIEIGLFPAATYFTNVKLVSKSGNPLKINLEAGKFGLQFSYLDLFSKTFSIRKILVQDAEVNVETPSNYAKKNFNFQDLSKVKIKDLFSFYRQEIYNNIPLRIKDLELDDINLEIDSKKFVVSSLLLELSPKKISVKGVVENENLLMFSALYPGEQEVEFDLEATEKEGVIRKISFKNRQDLVRLEGNLTNVEDHLNFDGNLEFFVKMETMANAFPKVLELKKMDGMIYGKSLISKSLTDPQVKFQLSVFDFTSDFIDFNEIDITGRLEKERLSIETLRGTEANSSIELRGPIQIKDITKIDIGDHKIRIGISNFYSNKLLKFVSALEPVKAYFTGDLEVKNNNGNTFIQLGQGFEARDFILKFDEKSKSIFNNPRLELGGIKVSLFKENNIGVSGILGLGQSKLEVDGQIYPKGVQFKAKSNAEFSFKDLGPIAGVNFKGVGPLEISVAGPTENVVIGLKGIFNNFGFLGFNFGDVLAKIQYEISLNRLNLNQLTATFNNSELSASGSLVFGDYSEANIHILTPRTSYQDSLSIYQPLVKDLDWLQPIGDFEYLADYRITGPLDPKKIKVRGFLKGGESTIHGELINSFEAKYTFEKQKIFIDNFTVNNGKGHIVLSGEYNLMSTDFDYSVKTNGIRFSDLEIINFLNLGFDAEIVGFSKGVRRQGMLGSSTNLKLISSTIGSESVADSKFEMEIKEKKVSFLGNLFGESVRLKGGLDFNPRRKSFLDLKFEEKKLPVLLGIFSSHNIMNAKLKGELNAGLNLSFDIAKPQFCDLVLKINSFRWRDGVKEFIVHKNNNFILIKNGKIESWNINISAEEDYFRSQGTGQIFAGYQITNDFSFSPHMLHLLSPNIQQAEGKFKGEMVLKGNYPKLDLFFSGDLFLDKLKLINLPGVFEDFRISLLMNNDILSIKKIKGKYGKGDVSISGTLKNLPATPEINIIYELSNITFPVIKKSFVNFSGKGELRGEKRPYNLSGDFLLGYGEIRDTSKDIMKDDKTSENYGKWLPKKVKTADGRWLNLDMKIDLANRMNVKNKLVDIKLGGEISVAGDIRNRLVTGSLNAVPGISNFTFKGNKFVINEGLIDFQSYPRESPYLRLSASSSIKKYEVKVNANGKINKAIIDLSSEPSLPREDILSLITLGFTSRDTLGISDREKETMTSVGIGSLLADQLEIGEGLASDFGISLSVTTELQEIEKSNQPETREGSVLPTQSKFKSATRIGFKKQISEKSEISFSNTIGGTIDQKQEVSGEYFLNSNTSVRGTYEMFNSSNREVQDSGAQSNNLGVDLIFKWSFK